MSLSCHDSHTDVRYKTLCVTVHTVYLNKESWKYIQFNIILKNEQQDPHNLRGYLPHLDPHRHHPGVLRQESRQQQLGLASDGQHDALSGAEQNINILRYFQTNILISIYLDQLSPPVAALLPALWQLLRAGEPGAQAPRRRPGSVLQGARRVLW